MPKAKRPTESKPIRRRKNRARTTPKWLREQQDLDEVARRRCLLILSVLSGEKPVTNAIAEAKISRQTYYHLEDKALNAMLRALSPGASTEETASAGAVKRAQELEAKVEKLETERRRSERLLHLTRKLVGSGPMKTASSRRRRAGSKATGTSKRPTTHSSKSPASSTATATTTSPPSTRTKAGGGES